MCIILRLICEILSGIAVKIRFLRSSVIYSNLSCHDIYARTWENLHQLFCIWTSYVSLKDYLMIILKFYTAPVRLHDVINIVNQKAHSCKDVSIIFYRENMTSFLNYVTATLRTLYAWRASYCTSIIYILSWTWIGTYSLFSLLQTNNITPTNFVCGITGIISLSICLSICLGRICFMLP